MKAGVQLAPVRLEITAQCFPRSDLIIVLKPDVSGIKLGIGKGLGLRIGLGLGLWLGLGSGLIFSLSS